MNKVLQVGKFFPVRGGVEKVMYDAMVGLSERGVGCDMLCAATDGPSTEVAVNGRARVFCTKTWFKAYATMISPAMILKLRSICKDYDIVHIHHPDPMATLALLLSGYKGPMVLHWHSDIEKQKKLIRFYMPFQTWLLRRADMIVGTTDIYLKESPFLKDYQHKTRAIPIGVDRVVPDMLKAEEIRSRYPGRKIVFSLGRLVHYKGFRTLVDAAGHLPDDYVVLIGGEGALREELKAHIRVAGLVGKVELLGRIPDDDLPGYFGACDLFCLSSVQKTEAFGIVQIEAMSCGKPVVATRIEGSGVSWVNADGVSGLNVPAKDPEAMAKAMKTILEDPELYAALSLGAARRYDEMFGKEKMIDNIMQAYEDLWKK